MMRGNLHSFSYNIPSRLAKGAYVDEYNGANAFSLWEKVNSPFMISTRSLHFSAFQGS